MPTSRVAASLLIAIFAVTARASDIYKCVAPDGRTSFQDSPCVANTTGDRLTVHPNVVVPIDQSAAIIASQAISDRVSARNRAADNAALRERMLREASMGPPVQQPVAEPPYFYDYAPYAYFPRVKPRSDRAPPVNVRSHVPVEQRKRR